MAFIPHRETSRINWGKEVEGKSNPDRDDIKMGCLLRIADATEAMATSHVQLQASLDYYKRAYNGESESCRRLARQVNSLRGVITKLKNKAPK